MLTKGNNGNKGHTVMHVKISDTIKHYYEYNRSKFTSIFQFPIIA